MDYLRFASALALEISTSFAFRGPDQILIYPNANGSVPSYAAGQDWTCLHAPKSWTQPDGGLTRRSVIRDGCAAPKDQPSGLIALASSLPLVKSLVSLGIDGNPILKTDDTNYGPQPAELFDLVYFASCARPGHTPGGLQRTTLEMSLNPSIPLSAISRTLSAQSRTLRIRQDDGLDLSIAASTSPLRAVAILPLSDFHEVSQGRGPK